MILEIINLFKSFGDKNLFNGFSMKTEEKGIYVITGESGSGKTTLLNMIAGLDNSYTGTIVGGGLKNVSFAFQEYRLFPGLSAIDNVIYANNDRKDKAVIEEARNMLLNLGINENDFSAFPHELSGGMKQRVSLARAFLRKSPILLLDEPTKELDEINVKLVLQEIKRQSEFRLVIMVSHNVNDVNELNAIRININ